MKGLTREILREAINHGGCVGETEVFSACESQPCDVDCLWGDWEAEAACSKPCGGGVQILTRTRARNASGNGQPCLGENTRLGHYNETLCPGVISLIVVIPVIPVIAVIAIGFLCYRHRYSRLDLPPMSFEMPDIIRL